VSAPAGGPLRRALADGRLLLDGAMGTALLARGLPPGALPEEWVLARPAEVSAVHASHAAAGARVVLTCTFSLAAPRLEARLDRGARGRAAAEAVRLARAAAPGALVAGALGPTGLAGAWGASSPREGDGRARRGDHQASGSAGPSAAGSGNAGDARAGSGLAGAGSASAGEEIAGRYRAAAEALAEAGADLLWLETQLDAGEARVALAAALGTGLEAALTFALREVDGRLVAPDGTAAERLLQLAQEEGAAAAGVNCVAPGAALDGLAAWAGSRLRVPLVLKPSPGLPGALLAPGDFARALAPALSHARLAGGCCGADAAHLAALARVFR
jgi:5-methyltetrahydrofolate--homocysteine methyltransferase